MTDPLTPLSYVDQLSLLLGLHEQSQVVVVSAHQWSTDVHVFTFQRRLKDGAFYLNKELKETVDLSVFDQVTPENIEKKCQEIIRVCEQ